jgi:hypothetical protein
MTKEQRSRLEMMADPSSETWDLSDNDIAAIKAALAALAAREAEVAGPAWQPIETAPEATYVIVWVPNGGWRRALKTTHPSDGSVWWDGHERLFRPSHWMPLPTPPQPAPDTDGSTANVEDAIDAYWSRSAPEVQEHAPARSEDGQGPSEADITGTEGARCL